VGIELNEQGTKKFALFSSEHVGEHAGIRIEGELMMAPKLHEPIVDGTISLSLGEDDISEQDWIQKLQKRIQAFDLAETPIEKKVEDREDSEPLI